MIVSDTGTPGFPDERYMSSRTCAALLLASALIAGCGGDGDDPAPPAAAAVPAERPQSSIYAQAVAADGRLAEDYARDATRNPAAVLAFLGIGPGDIVLDLYSGGGYYSELLSHVVGPEGRVIAHTNEAYLGFVGDEFGRRHADGRLQNVEVLMADNNELDLEPASLDAIVLMLTYHDVYYAAPQRGWPKIDVRKLLAELEQGLKPGGIVGVVDHYAEAGAPRETGGTLHRIDPSVVVADFEAAGFELAGKSDVLRNMHDDYTKIVFDPELLGRTDRFVMKFKKPDRGT